MGYCDCNLFTLSDIWKLIWVCEIYNRKRDTVQNFGNKSIKLVNWEKCINFCNELCHKLSALSNNSGINVFAILSL